MEPRDDRGAASSSAGRRRRLAKVPARRVAAALCASASLLAAGVAGAGVDGVGVTGATAGTRATTGTGTVHADHTDRAARALVTVGASPAVGLGRAIGPAPAFLAHVVVSLDLGTPAAGVRAVTSWLESQQLHPVVRGTLVDVTAPSGVVARALHVRFASYRERAVGGAGAVYASGPPVLPAVVAAHVAGILGLSDAPLVSTATLAVTRPGPFAASGALGSSGSATAGTLAAPCTGATAEAATVEATASDGTVRTMAAIGDTYGVGGLVATGHDGAGATVAVIELAPSRPSDIATYDSCFGLPDANYSVDAVDGGAPVSGADPYLEPDLDIEQVQTQAPAADVVSVEAPNTTAGFADAIDAAIANPHVSVISISWASCEALAGSPGVPGSFVASLEPLLLEAAEQGQTVLVASGDDGSEACAYLGSADDTSTSVDYPASDPSVTAVGGTVIAGSGQPDVTWNACSTGASACTASDYTGPGYGGASTGGVSALFAEPSWQESAGTFAGPCGASGGCRAVPDISANADGNVVYEAGGWVTAVGTSAAAPLVAGLAADVESSCDVATEETAGLADPVGSPEYGSLGDLAPRLYSYAHAFAGGSALTDVTSGNNDWTRAVTGVAPGTDYPARSGYDLATGLGTPVGSGWLCPSVTALTVEGQPATSATVGQSLTVTGTGLADAVVTFGTSSIPATVTSASPNQLVVTVPSGSGLADVTVTGAVGSAAPQPFSITTAPVVTSAASVSATVGTAFSFTVTGSGSPLPTLAESGALPGGVSFVPGGGGTATLTGTPTQSGSYPLTVMASSSAGTASQQLELDVAPASSPASPPSPSPSPSPSPVPGYSPAPAPVTTTTTTTTTPAVGSSRPPGTRPRAPAGSRTPGRVEAVGSSQLHTTLAVARLYLRVQGGGGVSSGSVLLESGRVVLGAARFTAAPGSTALLVVPLDPTARALLTVAPDHVLRAVAVVRVAGQPAASRTVTLHLAGPLALAPLALVGPATVVAHSSAVRLLVEGRGEGLAGSVRLLVGRTLVGAAHFALGARAQTTVVVQLDEAGRVVLGHASRVVAIVDAAGYRPTARAVVLVG